MGSADAILARMSETILGHEVVGSGPRAIIVMNDWLCDTSTWRSARAYLDGTRFRWVFADLRGYGRSRGRAGQFTAQEAAADVLELADALELPRFAIVGHSMSTYVALHLAQHAVERVERVVVITPGPRRGFGADPAWLEQAQAMARDEVARARAVRERFAQRLSAGWGAYKCQRWMDVSDREASAAYIALYARDGLPAPDAPIAAPVLAITGEEDAEVMRRAATLESLSPICAQLEVTALLQCGHYPMEEMPPLSVALVERFCAM